MPRLLVRCGRKAPAVRTASLAIPPPNPDFQCDGFSDGRTAARDCRHSTLPRKHFLEITLRERRNLLIIGFYLRMRDSQHPGCAGRELRHPLSDGMPVQQAHPARARTTSCRRHGSVCCRGYSSLTSRIGPLPSSPVISLPLIVNRSSIQPSSIQSMYIVLRKTAPIPSVALS